MRILLTGHKGYIGAVAGPILRPPATKLSAWTRICLQAAISANRLRKFRKSAKTCAT